MKTLRWFIFSLIVSVAWSICAQNNTQPSRWLLPKPKNITDNGNVFDLHRAVRITDPTASTLLASIFTISEEATATVIVSLVDATALGTFDYTLAGFDNEGYKLNVEADAITITAATKTGVIRAAQTLIQLAAASNGEYIQGVDITDYPAFKLRGFMHDVGRSFISFDELKKEIDLLSRFKVNVFHWHLTDNQGFRFESRLYPQLNQADNMTRFAGSYYTQAQCTELEAYAAERGITIIPEIDMPGHSTAFTNAMGYTMSSDNGKVTLKALLSELADAFPLAPYIHMGADEAGTTAAFVNEMSQYIKETLGRKCIVWNPISGVSISTSTLPYIDMTEMWSSSGRKIDGLPNIDCRYNYINHFDVFADLVGIYKSNVYYAQQGSNEVAGVITAIWNDRKTASETDIISQNNFYANALATAERGWMGGGKQYIEVGGTTLPSSGTEYEEFADWECRFLRYKDTWLAEEPIPYVKQTNVRWRITQAFPNSGSASAVFPPETVTDDILPDQFTYDGQTYTTSMASGAGVYLRHVWGTTVPAHFSNPQTNTTAYAWTYVYSPMAQTAGALIEFQNYSRSENDKAPDAGKWDRKGSRIWINGEEVLPPTWTNSGKSINSEVDLGNENFPARNPVSVQLREGWNKVFLKLPYVSVSNIRLNKWMFTFVLTDPAGRHALDGITYSPIQSLDDNAEIVVAKVGEIKTYVNSVCNTQVGYYHTSAAATLNAIVADIDATLQTTMTVSEREAQLNTLQTAFEAFKNSLSEQPINQPLASSLGEYHYYTLCTPLRGTRYATSTGVGGELGGGTTVTVASCWKFVSRGDGTFDILNAADGSYILPNSNNNTVLKTQTEVPSVGWTIAKANETGYVIITSGSCQINQTNLSSTALSGGYRIYNWGEGTNTSDTGCKYVITEIDEADIPFPLSSIVLEELTNHDIIIPATAATSLTTGQWYIMKNIGRNGYLYEKVADHILYTEADIPGGYAPDNAQFLIRLVDAGDGKYYIQTGYGNYFSTLIDGNDGSGKGGNNNGTTAVGRSSYTIGKIASGYFYLTDANNVVMDANVVGATVAGWGTVIPTSTTGNASWQFYPVTLAAVDPTLCFHATDVTVCQGHQTAGRGNAMQALLRLKLTPFRTCTPTSVSITLTGAEQLDRVAIYITDIDQIHVAANPVKIGEAAVMDSNITVTTSSAPVLTANTPVYLWVTADIKSTATELASIDAAITAFAYSNASGNNICDLREKGNPAGVMRIFKRQQFLWTGSQSKEKYYRIPTIIRTSDGGVVALCDDRYDNTQDLGKVASGAAGKHKIDVVMRKSMDDGATWSDAQVVAAGDGNSAAACGYGDPAIVRTLSGKLVCLMAAGSTSFPNGMLHMGYSESKDNGSTWSTPKDIYSTIKKNGLSITSAFTSAGKGICFSNGRIAFAMNGKVDGVCNEYILYSDDEGATWTIAPNMACASADESKLEIMNDNSLILSVRQGGWNSQANRAYSRTEGDASGDGINNWGGKSYWTDLNANGCNADILYYSRQTDDGGMRDLMLHTAVKTFQTYRKDLRLYMSFDQGQTWQEAFQLQLGYSAYSSMQKLANGDLAIIFEDGSLGNQDKMDCYAMTYLIISRETLESRAEEVWQAKQNAANMVKIVYENSKETELGKWDIDNTSGRNIWTSITPANPVAGLTLRKSAGTFDRYTGWNGFYNLAYKVGAANRNEVLTLTAPDGYLIKGYSFQVQEWSNGAAANDFTIRAEDGTAISPAYKGGVDGYTSFDIRDVQAKSTYFTVRSTNATKYLAIINFIVMLTSETEVNIESLASPTASTDYYNLAGQCIVKPTRSGLYIRGNKKVVVR
ncbi:MAG: family 20 glycosylhydrolase [Bacteroidaceae bacterium]|nr:family 20 glycosylhydrolase [Bacteroidaceae bacterium]